MAITVPYLALPSTLAAKALEIRGVQVAWHFLLGRRCASSCQPPLCPIPVTLPNSAASAPVCYRIISDSEFHFLFVVPSPPFQRTQAFILKCVLLACSVQTCIICTMTDIAKDPASMDFSVTSWRKTMNKEIKANKYITANGYRCSEGNREIRKQLL